MREMLAGVADRLSLHMPGAQGRGPFGPVDPYRLETTELGVTDDLYAPCGAIARAEALAARCAGAAHTLMLTGGSTAGVQAMLLYAAGGGGAVILPRNAHLSALHLCAVAGLDVVAREQFYQLLLEDFAQTGRTFLVSTHIIEEAASVFEQVIILDQGRILENSPTEELVEQFRYISGREDVVDQACAGLEVLSVQQMGRHKTAAVRGSDAQFRQARQADVDVSPMNLQNVFVALCGHGDTQ